jgi:hypothetical protein
MGGMAEAAPPPLPPAANGAPRVTVPAPAQGPRVVNLAALAKEYVAGAPFQAAADYLRSLTQYIDDVSRDLRADLYDEMLRTDPVISSGARMVKQSVLSDGITLRPAVDDEDDPLHDDAKAVCDFCTWVASNLRTPAEEVSEDLLSGMFLGNKLAEQVYARVEGGKYPGLWALDRVKPKPRESVRPVVDAYGNFVAVQARIPGDGLLSAAAGAGQQISDPRSVRNLLQRSKFAAFVWEPQNSDPRGTSVLRPCYINWWQKLQALGSWLQWLALCATPMLVGILSDKADAFPATDAAGNPLTGETPSPLQQLLNLLVQARSGNALALPAGTKVEWLTAPGKGDQFATAVTYHDQCMTRAITLQTLATQDSEHNTRAASQVHQDTLGVGVRKARGVLGRVWTWDVWYWLVYWNFGKAKADALCPRAVLAPVEQHDRQSQLPAYASVGYQLAPSQLQAVDEELGLPQRTPEEAKPPEPPQGAAGGGGTGGQADGDPLDAPFAWDESQHPRGQPENRGQFGPGGGGAGEGGPPGRPKKLVHERGEEIAERHVANMRALLGRLRSGAMSPEDVASDAQVYADRALEANQRNFAGRYNAFRARVAAEYGEDALRSQKWANVREVFTEARDAAAEQIRDGARVVKAAGDYQARRPGQEVYVSRGELEIIRDTLHELRRIHARFVDRLQGEFEDFRAARKPLPGHAGFSAVDADPPQTPPSGQEAGFAWDELRHPRDRIGRFAEAAGAEVAAHVMADAGARTSELHRSTGAVLKKILADLKPKVRAEVDALLPRAVARLAETTGLPGKTFRPLLRGAGALADAVMDHYRGQGRELRADIRNRLARWQPEDAAHALAGKFGPPPLTKEDVADALDDQTGRIVERYKEEHDPPEGLPPAEEEAAVARVTREAEQLESAIRAVLWATFNPPRAAGFAFDPSEPRDATGKWTAGGGAAPAWKAEVYRPPGGRYLGRKAETPAGTAQSAALDLGDHARYVWNALADTRDPGERRTQTAAALEEFRHEAGATLHDLARRLGDTPAAHAAADREAGRLHAHLEKVASRALDALDAAGKDRQKVKEARKELRRQMSAVIDRPHAAGGRGRDALAFGAAGRVLRASGQDVSFARPRTGGKGPGDEGGRWVTIEGEHVFIKGGVITKGPAALVGKDPANLPPRSGARPSAAPAHAQGSPAARAARVKAAFEALPAYDPEDNTRPTPFPTEPVRPYVGADAIRGALWESAPTQDVPLAALTAHQDDINRESVAHAAEHPGEPIQVVRVGGKLYVDDGTNRAAAALLAGEHAVPARVFDYDPATRTYTPVPRGGLGAA